MLEALLEEPLLDLEMTCHTEDSGSKARKTSNSTPSVVPCRILLVIYGPSRLFEEIGDFFQDYDTYLQDPLDCERDVKYYNPHRLSSGDMVSCPMTSALRDIADSAFKVEELPSQPDSLDLLDSQQDLPEADQPAPIQTPLKRYSRLLMKRDNFLADKHYSHQKQALTFMLQRERGWTFESNKLELWDIRYSDGRYW